MIVQFSLVGIAGFVMAVIAIVFTWRSNRRNKNFYKHVIASRKHLLNAVEAVRKDDLVEAELQLAASQEAIDRAELFIK